jgi:mono/diheme cytochrome c family protein
MRSVVGFGLVGMCVALMGCGADLGTCDSAASEQLVYLNGVPYFEGQGLVQQSCAGAQCHTVGAVGAARSGVPHSLDFDVEVLTAQSQEDRLDALRDGISLIRDKATELWTLIDNGEMPPGRAGERPKLAWKRDLEGVVDANLDGIDTADGRDIVRNWLACGSPIVSATDDSPYADQAARFGVVRPAGDARVEATWESVYANVLTQCASCHRPGSTFPDLDLSSSDTAYTELVGGSAMSGGACSGRILVTPNDCQGSVLYKKLQPAGMATDLCGDAMPLGGTAIPTDQLQAVCDWITAGAIK